MKLSTLFATLCLICSTLACSLSADQESAISPTPTVQISATTTDPALNGSLLMINPTGTPDPLNCTVAHPGGEAVVRVYKGPGTEYEQIAVLASFTYTYGVYQNWYQVGFMDYGGTGWVERSSVVQSGACANPELDIRCIFQPAMISIEPGDKLTLYNPPTEQGSPEVVSAFDTLLVTGIADEWVRVSPEGTDIGGWIRSSRGLTTGLCEDIPIITGQ